MTRKRANWGAMSDRYEFLRKIAQGGFGEVYVAKDTLLGREVAIKRLLTKEESATPDLAQDTFQREATTLAAMQHPNIVQIFDFDRDDEGTYVVMEMLEGETLKDRLNRGPLTWDTFVTVARQALDAINAAHSQGILHRDLKPENLFLHRTTSGSRVLKILDFGLAKLSHVPSRQTMDQSGNVFGSIYYMAPEQFMRQPLDGRTDLYALGCVFYQALTARFPFYGDNMQATMEAHMEHEVKPIRARRPDISAPMGDWLMRLISFRPGDRPADAMTAMRELEAALEGRTIQPPPKAGSGSHGARPDVALPSPARMNAAGVAVGKPNNPPSARPPAPTNRPSDLGSFAGTAYSRAPGAAEAVGEDAKARAKAAGRRKKLALRVGIPAVVLALILYGLSRRSSEVKLGAQGEPPLPEPAALVLPNEGALVWRFRAGAESRHLAPDPKIEAAPLMRGETVQFWRNLASVDKLAALLPLQGKAERAPVARAAKDKDAGPSHTHLYFPPGAGMEMKLKDTETAHAPGGGAANPPGVTLAAVFRTNAASNETAMRPVSLVGGNGKYSFSLHVNPRTSQFWALAERDGKIAQSLVAPEEFTKRKDGAGAAGTTAIVVALWDAKQGTVSIRVRGPNGQPAPGPAAAIPAGMGPLDRLNLGLLVPPKGSKLNPNEKFDGDIVEVAVYRHALDAANQDNLLTALWEHYLK